MLWRLLLLLALLVTLLAGAVEARSDPGPSPRPATERTRPPREILMEMGRPSVDPDQGVWNWAAKNFRIKGKGLEYRTEFKYRERRLKLKVQGPKVSGGFGLRFHLEF